MQKLAKGAADKRSAQLQIKGFDRTVGAVAVIFLPVLPHPRQRSMGGAVYGSAVSRKDFGIISIRWAETVESCVLLVYNRTYHVLLCPFVHRWATSVLSSGGTACET